MLITNSHLAPLRSMLGAQRLQLLPLFRRQLGAQRQQKARIGFFQFRTRLRYLVDRRHNRVLIRLIGVNQRPHRKLGLLQIGPQIDQPHAMLLQNPVHRLALILGQL